MRTRILLSLIFLSHLSAAQTVAIDSLRRELKKHSPDSVKTELMASMGGEYVNVQSDSAKHYLDIAYQMAIDLKSKKLQARSLNYLARYYSSQGQYYKAADYFLKCLNITGYFKEQETRTVTYYDLGQLYSALRNISGSDELVEKQKFYYKKSIEGFRQMKADEKKGDLRLLEAGACLELARAFKDRHTDSKKQDSAIFYFQKAYRLSDSLKFFFLVFASLEGIGDVYTERGQYDKAHEAAHSLQQLSMKQRSPFFVAQGHMKLGLFHVNDLVDSARYYLTQSLNEFRTLGTEGQLFLPLIYDQLGQVCMIKKSWLEAVRYFGLEKDIAKKIGQKNFVVASNSQTAGAYAAMGDYKKGYEFLTLYYIQKDSMLNEDTSAKLARLQSNFDSARQQDQIDLLEKEALVKELLLQQKQNQQLLMGAIALLFLGMVGFLFVRNRLINRSKREQEKLFREVDQMKARFFANLSHEFRTPLTLLLGPVEKRLDASTNKEDQAEFSVMHRNATRLLRLVDQLLDLSRLEAGTMKLQASSGELIGFIRTVMSSYQSMADSKAIRFELNCDQAAVPLYFDMDKLEKILNNLFSNAFKFTPDGGRIVVEVFQRMADRVEIRIKDSGIGIASEHLPRLFDRFYQVDSSATRQHEGTGIGLALTKELVDLHRGKITVESEVGSGTSLIVELPLGKEHLKSGQIISSDLPTAASGAPLVYLVSEESAAPEFDLGEWVLVIEDNADLRDHLRKELTPGYRVVLAKDGEEGIEIALKEIPTLIVTDLMMPRKSGLEVCTELKNDERTSHIPIILLTAKTEAESRLEGLKTGADDYIGKPFSMNELRVRIDNLIEGRRKLQRKYAHQAIVLNPADINPVSVDERFLKNAVKTMDKHISDTLFSVEVFAREMGMSQIQLYRKLTALTNYSPNEFIRHMRLKRATDLLAAKAGNVADIAYQSGFNNLSYFAKVFKEKYGMTPSEMLKKGSI